MPRKLPNARKVILSLVVICLLSGCREEIAHDLSEGDLRRVMTALTELGMPFERNRSADGTWTVAVDSGDESRAILALNERRVIRERRDPELQSPSIFSGPLDEQLRFERSLGDEIEKTLMSLDGVLEAKVHLNLPVKQVSLDGQKPKASGSVLVVVGPDFLTNDDEIAKLVAGAAGFEKERVAVLIKAGRIIEGFEKKIEVASTLPGVLPIKLVGLMGAIVGGSLLWGGVKWKIRKVP